MTPLLLKNTKNMSRFMLSKIKVKKLMQFYLGELHNYHNNHLLLIKILVFKREKDCAC